MDVSLSCIDLSLAPSTLFNFILSIYPGFLYYTGSVDQELTPLNKYTIISLNSTYLEKIEVSSLPSRLHIFHVPYGMI